MATMQKNEIQSLLDRLEQLTKNMDVPDYKQRNPLWLKDYMAIRNSNHKNFKEALEISEKLVSNGVWKG